MTVTERQIVEALHDRYWKYYSNESGLLTTIEFDDYKTAVFRAGLIKTMSTAKIRWDSLASAKGFVETHKLSTYAINLKAIREAYGLSQAVRETEETETEREIEEAY